MVSVTNSGPLANPWGVNPSRDVEAEAMLATLFVDRVDEMSDAIMGRVMAAFPQAGELGDEFVQDVVEKARNTMRRALQLLSTGDSFDVMGPMIEEVARHRRRQQLTEEMILFGYRYIQHVLFEEITNDIRDHPQAQRISDALSLRQLEFQYVVSRRVAAAFDTGAEALALSREEAVQALLEMLVGQRPGTANLDEYGQQFGLLLPLDHIAVTITSADARPGARDDIKVRKIARLNPWSIVGELKGRIVVIGRNEPWGIEGRWGGCAVSQETLLRPDLLSQRIVLAGEAADVAGRLGMDRADADDVAPFIAVSQIPPDRQESFLRSLFGDLHTSSRGLPILQAVAVSASTAGRREAARRLKVHPNTLDYRLSRFRELTGINLADPIQRLRCDLGLFLLGLLGDA